MRSLGILALAGLLTMACRDSSEPPLVAEDILRLDPRADKVGFNVKHYVTSEGVRRVLVEADTAFYIEDEGTVELRQMQVTFYNSMGEVTSVLTAEAGTYNWNTGDMTAETNVVVDNSEDGRRIETSILHYDRAEDRIWSDAPTKMTEADGTVVEGTAFQSNSSMEDIEITSARMVRPGSQPQPQLEP